MTEISIMDVKLRQTITCKCGRALTPSDIDTVGDWIKIICTACHSSIMEIEVYVPRRSHWD